GGSPNAGWFSYANITEKPFNLGHGIDFWVLGLLLLGVASLAAAFNFIVTIINMRAPGMSLMRMPVFVWMTLVTSFLIVTAFPVITVALIELMFDRKFGTNFFMPGAGGDPLLWQHLFWVFGHPEVYILILPAMGIVSEVLPTYSRKPLFGYPVVVFSGITIGFMGWMVWSHHMFTVGLGPVANSVFALTTMAIAVPTGVKIFNWMATMWRGSVEFKTAMLFAVGFIAMFIIGGLSGIMHSVPPSDAQQQDTYFIVAHIHYVLFGGAIFAVFSGIYYWFPKASGRLLSEGWGKLHFWLTFIGFNVTFFPMHISGLLGMPRRIYTYPASLEVGAYNLMSTIGAFVLMLSLLVFLYNFFRSIRHGEAAGNDPWDGRTLEWSIPSPPPLHNFDRIPIVHGRDSYWEEKQHRKLAPVAGGSANGDGDGHSSQPRHGSSYGSQGHGEGAGEHQGIHIPSPSIMPLLIALGLTIAAFGMIYNLAFVFIGVFTSLVAIYGWTLEPPVAPEKH
ncbi:MAG: cbb3-type cytochrome c oxidase subunit I, partial [Chloroflexi bacterium]|nr:cbb3-type cytochrome c oxidase subunit I [Chloroflexota bacterium]